MSRNQRIKDALREKGIIQKKLAEHLNLTQAAIGKQLNKEGLIDSIAFVDAVAELTGYHRDYLIYGEETTLTMPEKYRTEVDTLREEVKTLKHEIEVLRSALREIGKGGSIPNRHVGQ